ncbi:hypothetical protein ACKVWC_000735 [Pyricularia oryzae]
MHRCFTLALLTLGASANSAGPTRIDPGWHLAAHHPDGQCGHAQTGLPTMLRAQQPECPPPIGKDTAGHDSPGDWAPWTHAPYCVANSSYCVLTNAAFQRGRGFSIVAAPRALASMQAQLELAFAAPARSAVPHRVEIGQGDGGGAALNRSSSSSSSSTPAWLNDSSPPPAWEVKKIPGKGLGMVAKRRIPRGETFLVDYAAILASVEFPGRVRRAQGIKLLDRAAGQLPDPERVLRLARSSTQDAEFGMTYQSRQSTLLHRWGFKCTCALCSAPPSAVAASDARRTRAMSVRDGILAAVEAGELREAIELGKQLVDISAREGLASGLGDHYEVLARLHAAVGDLQGAGAYARRALEEMSVFGGSEAYGSFDELDLFVRNLEGRARRG